MKAYYYDVTVSPSYNADKNIIRFKSFNKRTIKKYLEDHFIFYDTIFDPYEKKELNEVYIDVTAVNIPMTKK